MQQQQINRVVGIGVIALAAIVLIRFLPALLSLAFNLIYVAVIIVLILGGVYMISRMLKKKTWNEQHVFNLLLWRFYILRYLYRAIAKKEKSIGF